VASVAEALRTLGVEATEQTLIASVIDVMATFPPAERRGVPESELTAAEAEILRQGGMDLTARNYGADDPFLRTRSKYGLLVATGLSVAKVAANLGTTEARVRQRLKGRTLYGVKSGDVWRLPGFQFLDDGRPVPGIERVAPRLDPHVNLVSVYNWFTQPDTDLRIEGREVSPREWLEAGYDPDMVAQQATAI